MRLSVASDNDVKVIAQWLSDNVSQGYAFIPSTGAKNLMGIQYRAYDRNWAVLHFYDLDEAREYASVEGLDQEHEVMLCLQFAN